MPEDRGWCHLCLRHNQEHLATLETQSELEGVSLTPTTLISLFSPLVGGAWCLTGVWAGTDTGPTLGSGGAGGCSAAFGGRPSM